MDAQAMRQIGRELEREEQIVEREDVADIGTQGRIVVQLQQSLVVFAELEFARRAEHALALDATQLAELDQEGLAILTGRQLGPHQRAGHLDADARVGRTADDVEQRIPADVDLAYAQAVRVGMLHGLLDLADDDAAERRRHGASLFDFEAAHGERLGQFGTGQRRVAELAQPGLGKLHSLFSQGSMGDAGSPKRVTGIATGIAGRRRRRGAGRSRHSAAW